MRTSARLAACSLALASLVPAARADVWVVDAAAGPGSHFTTIGAAVAAAGEGDVVLVRGGHYPEHVQVATKSLALIADAGADVSIDSLRVATMAGGREFLARGIDVIADPGATKPRALEVWFCSGDIWFEDCTFASSLALGHRADGAAVHASKVKFVRCTLEGGTRVALPGNAAEGGSGLALSISTAALYQCSVRGGDGAAPLAADPFPTPSGDGGDGARVEGGELYAMDCAFEGGDGAVGSTTAAGCTTAGAGGDGIASLLSSIVYAFGGLLEGGTGGAPLTPCGGGGHGAPTSGPSIAQFPLQRHGIELQSPVVQGGALTGALEGAAGEIAILVVAPPGNSVSPLTWWSGALVVDPAAPMIVLGTVPASGTLPLAAVAPALPGGIDAAQLNVQPFFLAPATLEGILGAPTALTVLASAP